MICVYPADCTDFSNNGFGAVTPMSCTVTETLNGEWEVTLVHDIDERGKPVPQRHKALLSYSTMWAHPPFPHGRTALETTDGC